MNDFKQSLLAGISAAQAAKNKKLEIQNIIKEIDNLLVDMYIGKVRFGVKEITKIVNRKVTASNGTIISIPTPVRRLTLALTEANGENPYSLAEWSESEDGYPCKISYEGNDIYCTNGDELRGQLAIIFSDVKTGKAILEKLGPDEPLLEELIE